MGTTPSSNDNSSKDTLIDLHRFLRDHSKLPKEAFSSESDNAFTVDYMVKVAEERGINLDSVFDKVSATQKDVRDGEIFSNIAFPMAIVINCFINIGATETVAATAIGFAYWGVVNFTGKKQLQYTADNMIRDVFSYNPTPAHGEQKLRLT